MKINKIFLVLLIVISFFIYTQFTSANYFIGKWEHKRFNEYTQAFDNDHIYIFKDQTALIDGVWRLKCDWELKSEKMMLLTCDFSKDNKLVEVLNYSSHNQITVNTKEVYVKVSDNVE